MIVMDWPDFAVTDGEETFFSVRHLCVTIGALDENLRQHQVYARCSRLRGTGSRPGADVPVAGNLMATPRGSFNSSAMWSTVCP
jgi:hypothetical protein